MSLVESESMHSSLESVRFGRVVERDEHVTLRVSCLVGRHFDLTRVEGNGSFLLSGFGDGFQ